MTPEQLQKNVAECTRILALLAEPPEPMTPEERARLEAQLEDLRYDRNRTKQQRLEI